MTEPETYMQARARLLAYPVPAFEDGVTPAAAVHELARLGEESADLLARTVDPGEPNGQDVAETLRRRAAVLVHLAEAHPEYTTTARRAIALWQSAEDRHTEAVYRAAVQR